MCLSPVSSARKDLAQKNGVSFTRSPGNSQRESGAEFKSCYVPKHHNYNCESPAALKTYLWDSSKTKGIIHHEITR